MNVKETKRRFKAYTSMEEVGMANVLVVAVLDILDGYEQLEASVVTVDGEREELHKRIAELEADIKLLEDGVVTVDGEREVLYGRIDELVQAMKGGA